MRMKILTILAVGGLVLGASGPMQASDLGDSQSASSLSGSQLPAAAGHATITIAMSWGALPEAALFSDYGGTDLVVPVRCREGSPGYSALMVVMDACVAKCASDNGMIEDYWSDPQYNETGFPDGFYTCEDGCRVQRNASQEAQCSDGSNLD